MNFLEINFSRTTQIYDVNSLHADHDESYRTFLMRIGNREIGNTAYD